MAEKETKEERRARIQKEVAAESAARKQAYFETQAKSKAGAEALAPDLPAADAYRYSYAWKQDPGAPTGALKLIKNPNPYYDASSNTIVDPATGERTPAVQSMWSGPTTFRADGAVVTTGSDVRDPVTGLTPAQKEAADALAKAKADAASLAAALGAKIDPNTGKIISSTIDPTKAATWYQTQPQSTITKTDGSGNTVFSGNTNTGNTDTGTLTGPATNVDVLKSLLRGMGFSMSLVDSSADFLNRLLKDGLDYDNAIAIFLDSKEYTFKDGKKFISPFYTAYGYLNEGLTTPKSASELFNAVEGYKGIISKYALSDKYISSDSLKKYVKNNVSVSELDERANAARLKAVNADKSYTDALQALGYIKSPTDLTDFFLNPDIGKEVLEQNRATAAFSAEAIRRAQQGIKFDAARFGKIAAGLMGLGLSEEKIAATAATGFEQIGQQLAPTQKLSGIYENLPAYDVASQVDAIQQELEAEQFLGTASERRKKLKAQEEAAFQRSAGTTTASLRGARAGII